MSDEGAPGDHRFDFTVSHYRELLGLAKEHYDFVFYEDANPAERIVLWRHDLDYSINRALRLAQIEVEEGVKATYFVHLHSKFYHWGEKEITEKLREIQGLGHQLGLHFDPDFYRGRMNGEKELFKCLAWEKQLLETEFNQEIKVFSFHNPDIGGDWLKLDADNLAGMVNAYGRTLKENFSYCSDSNGYWRFRRLWDVLEVADEERLQILTHPGWWQERVMHPKERIVRCIEGRKQNTIATYDYCLQEVGRGNLYDLNEDFARLKQLLRGKGAVLEWSWLIGQTTTVFIELWRLFEQQQYKFCKVYFRKVLKASTLEVETIMQGEMQLPIHLVFASIHEKPWSEIAEVTCSDYDHWRNVWNQLVCGVQSYPRQTLSDGIRFLVGILDRLAECGKRTPMLGLNGLQHLGQAGLPRKRIDQCVLVAWMEERRIVLKLPKDSWQACKNTLIAKLESA